MNTQQVRAYHERSKHRLDAYAKGPQYLDWEQQPNPFRRFAGADVVELPLEEKGGVAALLQFSLGLSAWKQYGPDRWALRCNPSSGNLHPTEGYIVATGIDGLGDGVYHYTPHEHALELRGKLTPTDAPPQLLLGLSSIAWREAWKYGERAFRYVQLDAGHALGAIRYAAAALGLQVELLPVTDADIATLLGLDRTGDFEGAEAEHPDMLLHIYSGTVTPAAYLPTVSEWYGKANALGGFPHPEWPVIDEISSATTCTRRGVLHTPPSSPPHPAPQPDLIPPDPPTPQRPGVQWQEQQLVTGRFLPDAERLDARQHTCAVGWLEPADPPASGLLRPPGRRFAARLIRPTPPRGCQNPIAVRHEP